MTPHKRFQETLKWRQARIVTTAANTNTSRLSLTLTLLTLVTVPDQQTLSDCHFSVYWHRVWRHLPPL